MEDLGRMTETHRYRLAIVFVGGFLAILMVALVGEILGIYKGIENLAAIFSGWVTAVIGFYFLGQSAAHAQQRTRDATEEAVKARQAKSDIENAKRRITFEGKLNVEELRHIIEDYQRLVEELIKKLEDTKGGEN